MDDDEIMPSSKFMKQLLPHERELLKAGQLENKTHARSTSAWLEALPPSLSSLPFLPSLASQKEKETSLSSSSPLSLFCFLYRPMGDKELLFLLEKNQLPNTQPYQAIMEGKEGREYAKKYLTGSKKVDTSPTTVVEFCVCLEMKEEMFLRQVKCEDGCLSHGLGDKAEICLFLMKQLLMGELPTES